MRIREALVVLQKWRARSYSDEKLVIMEKSILRWHGKMGITNEELHDSILDLIGDWTGAGVPDVGDIRKRVYAERERARRELGNRDPTATEPDLRLGGHDGHGNKFMDRTELRTALDKLKRDCPSAWAAPAADDSIRARVDRIYRIALENGLARNDY